MNMLDSGYIAGCVLIHGYHELRVIVIYQLKVTNFSFFCCFIRQEICYLDIYFFIATRETKSTSLFLKVPMCT